MKLPTEGGLCASCCAREGCDIEDMLKRHRQNIKDHGEDYKITRPDLWYEDSIDEPEIGSGSVIWCPLYERPYGQKEVE